MSGCRDDIAEVGTMFHSSGGARQRIYKQPPATVDGCLNLAGPSGRDSVVNGYLVRETAVGEDECSSNPVVTSGNLFCRLILVIAVSLTLFVVGTVLFVGGFFLSREDLPYISNGRIIPFPPLFPHLDPARLQLNREEGLYYVENRIRSAARSTSEHVNADGAPQPLYLEQFTDPKLSTVSAEPEPCQTENCGSSWVSVTPYDRVAILLIDAMRFDFLLWDPEASSACADYTTKECAGAPSGLRPFYRNRMPFAHDLLRRSDAELRRFLFSVVNGKETPEQAVNSTATEQKDVNETKLAAGASVQQSGLTGSSSIDSWGGNRFTRLYIFEADPPTATTQRLTGLATGSMPSFFSVRETFSASAVNVDSLLLQLKAANKTSVAIGDDTWDRTFGHLLTRLHVFPSLNIQDLNTVDDRVAAELPREFSKGDWTFLVGHVLGVDHVGHAAVLDSALMHKKLTDMNGMVKNMLKLIFEHSSNAVSARPNQTLFLAFGDHGMTEAGSHGGGSSEEVDAGLISFSMLPAMLSPRTAQVLSPDTRLFTGRPPTYLQSHGAFRDSSGRRRVGSGAAFDAASPTAALGYGSRRISQVGLAPTLSLLLGLPIPFNSMGRIIADLVPSIASFVQECTPEAQAESLSAFKCGTNDGKSCGLAESGDFAIARRVRCSDLAYLTQLHHIVAWQQHRAIMTLAALTGNGAVLADPHFAAAKVKWLRLYSELDKEIKSLPEAAHVPLTSGSSVHTFTRKELDATMSFPAAGFETADAELLSHISRLSQTPTDGDRAGEHGDAHIRGAKEAAAGVSSALPSLVPYLRACADFSQEAWQASVRQLCTFNVVLMVCGILMALSSVIILGLAAWALRNPFRASANPNPGVRTTCSLPELATIARWLRISACIGGGTWAAGWASLEVFKNVHGDHTPELDVFLWRLFPAFCLTGVLCSAVVPFARSALSSPPGSSAHRHLLPDSSHGGDEPPFSGEQTSWGLSKLLQQDLCLSHLWLRLFNGGRFHCYAALFVLCIIPFSDCFVERECSIVKFLISIYCISAGLTAFATPSAKGERKQIVAACAALALCVRIGNAFDPADSADKGGANGWPLQIDSTSASAILMFCIYCVVGMKELPLVSRLFGSREGGTRCRESEENSRFRIASFHRRREQKEARSCTFERDILLTQGAIAVLWFAFPHGSNSQQPASEGSQHHHGGYNTLIDDALVFVWSAIVYPFKVLDAAGAAVFGRLTPPGPWLYPAPRCLLRVIPSQLLYGGQVKLVPLLNVLLPWVIYVFTAGLWVRLVLILCCMKKRRSELSRQQLRNAKEKRTALGEEFDGCSNVGGPSQQAAPRKESVSALWGITLWNHFSYYFFFTAICPLCLFAVLLGRAQLWPLLLCCVKWRLLLFLGRVLVVQPSEAPEHKCKCSFCSVTRAASAVPLTDGTGHRQESGNASGDYSRPNPGVEFFLSDGSFCMLAALLATEAFFVTGHRAKLSALPVEAGFVGLLEFHPLWSFVTPFLHTYVVYMICCPLIFMLIFLRKAHLATEKATPTAQALQRSTAPAVVQTTALMVGKTAFGILMGVTFKHFCSLLSLTLLRHHLFIWDLFAVKFLFDITAACVMYALIVLTFFIVVIGAQRTSKVVLASS